MLDHQKSETVPEKYLLLLYWLCQRLFKLPHSWTHLSSVQFSRSVVSNSLQPHESQHARPPSHTSKVMLKFVQVRLQQYTNPELPDVQAGFRKGRGTREQIANICWIIEKAREFRKNIYFCFIDYVKPWTMGNTTNCGKFLKKWEYQTTWPAS